MKRKLGCSEEELKKKILTEEKCFQLLISSIHVKDPLAAKWFGKIEGLDIDSLIHLAIAPDIHYFDKHELTTPRYVCLLQL